MTEGGTTTPSLLTEGTTEGEPQGEPTVELAVPFVPLTVEDLTLPEGFTADEQLLPEFLKVVNDQEMDAKSRANALVDLQSKLMTKASEAGSAAWDKVQNEWRDAVKSDPAIGGDKMQPALASVSKLIAEYGSKELTGVFDLTGAGNNVHVIKFLHTLAEKLTEGGFAQGQPTNTAQDAASRLYPSMKG